MKTIQMILQLFNLFKKEIQKIWRYNIIKKWRKHYNSVTNRGHNFLFEKVHPYENMPNFGGEEIERESVIIQKREKIPYFKGLWRCKIYFFLNKSKDNPLKKSSLKITLEFFGTAFLFAIIFALIDLSEAREGIKLTKGFFFRLAYPDYLVFSIIAGLLYAGRQVYKRIKSIEEKRSITDVVLESLAIAWLIAIFLNLSFFIGQLKYINKEYYAQIFLLRFGHHPLYFTVGAVIGLGYGFFQLYKISLQFKKGEGYSKVVL